MNTVPLFRIDVKKVFPSKNAALGYSESLLRVLSGDSKIARTIIDERVQCHCKVIPAVRCVYKEHTVICGFCKDICEYCKYY